MRLLSIDSVKESMQIAKNIYTADGRILLAEGVSLTETYIEKLKELGVASLYIVDNRVGKVYIDPLVCDQTRLEALKITKEIMAKVHDAQTINGVKVRQIIGEITEELVSNPNVLVNLVEIRALNDYTFGHCLSVCILSVMTAIDLGYDYQRLKDLGTGAILHDLGKTFISDRILNKPGELTPEETLEVQNHTILGFEAIRNCADLNMTAADIACQHHEKYDGSGYPYGLKGTNIHELARLVAVADVYDALTTDRVYRRRVLPHEVIEYVRDSAGIAFDPVIAKAFLKNVAPFPVGSLVILNTKEVAVVINVTKDFPLRPLVRVIIDQEGNSLTVPVEKDLQSDLTLFIMQALEDKGDSFN